MIGQLTDQEVSALRALLSEGMAPGNKTIDGTLRVTSGIAAFGAAPATVQPSAIADPSGVTTDEDVEARAAINDILAVLRANGTIAT